MAAKPELIAFSQYKIGGVQSFYHNILSHDLTNQFDKKWILVDSDLDSDPKPLQPFGCCEEVVFNADNFESFYKLASAFRKLISPREGVALTNFEMELGTLHLYRCRKKTIYFICHDEGYVHRAVKYSFMIDVFIAHNPYFKERLQQELPERINDIFYIPYGVPSRKIKLDFNKTGNFKVVFAARLQKAKGVYDISEIDTKLKQRQIQVSWTIIGAGPEKESLQNLLMPRGNFEFHTPADPSGVLQLMENKDVFLLPSRREGLPVAMLEAMSMGCVPIVSNFNPGISKIITSDIGYVIPTDDTEGMVDSIEELYRQRDLLQKLSFNAHKIVSEQFNVNIQSKKYYDLFGKYKELKKPLKRKFIRYGSLLSHPYVPSILAKAIRKWRGVKLAGVLS